MNEEKYNGWSNRETWAVKLHWDNNEGDYKFFSDAAKEHKERGDNIYVFAYFLKEQYEQIEETARNKEATQEAMDMIFDVGSSWRVDWDEIAKAYYDEVEE